MAGKSAHDSSTLNAMWKEVYATEVENLVPNFAKATKKYKFQEGKKIGDSYEQPVIVHRSHGFTRGRGLRTLRPAIVHQAERAKLNPQPLYLREIISYDTAARMVENKASFVLHSKQLVQQMLESAYYRNEIEFFYGQDSLGVATGSANVNTTKTVVTIDPKEWAPAIWAGAENSLVKFHVVSSSALVSSGADAEFVVAAVDADARKLTIEGTTTGINALDLALAAPCSITWADGSDAAKGDLENPGMKKILSNSGTLFNINAGAYSLWRGNVYSNGNADVTMRKLLQAGSQAVGRGLAEDVDVWISVKSFESLNIDQAALREYGMAEKTAKNGFGGIEFQGAGGLMTIIPHPMVKEGDFFIIPEKRVVRTGSTDITFELPGKSGEIFLHKDEQNGYELRLMAEVGQMLTTPARAVYGKDIVNS